MSVTPLRSLNFAAVSGKSIDYLQFRLLKISTDDADQRGGDIGKGKLSYNAAAKPHLRRS